MIIDVSGVCVIINKNIHIRLYVQSDDFKLELETEVA